MSRLRALLIFGTRPEAIKMAPVVRDCRARPDEIETLVCLTGQHREMLAQVTDYFQLQADEDLQLMQPDQTLAELTVPLHWGHRRRWSRSTSLTASWPRETPQRSWPARWSPSIAAFRWCTWRRACGPATCRRPGPRSSTGGSRASSRHSHCAPTSRAAQNLLEEKVPPATVHVTGNTVIDALLWAVDRERANDARLAGQVCDAGRSPDGA